MTAPHHRPGVPARKRSGEQPRQPRRPLTMEERRQLEERKAYRREKAEESRELAKGPLDLPFLLLVLLLTGVGLIMLLSASFPSAYNGPKNNPIYFFVRQGLFAVAGIAAMLFVSKINYKRFRNMARPLMFVAIVLLVLVAIPGIGQVRNNARRWISVFGIFDFQPSEIAKVALVLSFADTISRKKARMRYFREGILPYLLWFALIGGLMMLEPHLSGTVIILGTGCVMLLVGGIRWIWVVGGAGAAGVLGWLIIGVFHYGRSRIEMWFNPWIDARGAGYQLCQSLLAIGSGGLLGKGLGKGSQKFMYLPEEHNDFIFSTVCEELGLLGAVCIMALFAALILRGYWIALYSRDRFGSLVVVGVTTLIALQTFLNIGVVTGFLPTTGISLPFFSYGGTALMMQLAEMGIVLSVSRQMKPTRAG